MNLRHALAPGVVAVVACACVAWSWPTALGTWRSIAIVTAWAGTGTLIASTGLMVREPHWAAWLGGVDHMYRWHHRSGTLAYVLLLVHPLALAAGAWQEAPRLAWQAITPWTTSGPILLGWCALSLLMLGLGSTFSVRLPYRRWRALHYALALGVIAGLAHIYVLLGNETILLALLVACAIALGVRLLLSDLGLGAHPYSVTRVDRLADHVVELTLIPRAAAMRVTPGQFVLAAFDAGPRYAGCGEFHPFTVSAAGGDQHSMRLAIKALGPCTTRVQDIQPATPVRLQGPFGAFLAGVAARPQLWIAGGVGITPFMAALRAQPPSQPTALMYLYRSARDAPFRDELEAYARAHPSLRLLSDASGDRLPDFARLLDRIAHLAEREVRICGPRPMVDALRKPLHDRGVNADRIRYESFDFR